MAPLDPIIGLNEEYNRDDFPNKVIVGVGAYRDDGGKPYVLPCVREAEERILGQNLDMEYSGIVSLSRFTNLPLQPLQCSNISFAWASFRRLETPSSSRKR